MLERVKEIVAEQLDISVEEISRETDFQKDLDADSLDLYEMIMVMEEEFNISIPAEELEDIHTVGDLEDKLQELQ